MWGAFAAEICDLFTAAEQNFGSHKFKYDGETGKTVTQWLDNAEQRLLRTENRKVRPAIWKMPQ
jgi:hypothetical protein